MENSEWVSSGSLSTVRYFAAAAQLPGGKILVTGGYNGSAKINGVEILTEGGWETIMPSLPVTFADHCMVTLNWTTVMVIGGYQNGQVSRKTFYYTLGEESWTEGPELKIKRIHQSCGRIRRDKDSQEMSIIVAGGYDGLFLSSVEILNEGSKEWQTGPELPFEIERSQIVEDPNGGVVLIGGQLLSIKNYDALFQLPHIGQGAKWTQMEQKLKIGRREQTAFLVPDSIVDCS